jgi:hypothetical protein
MYIVLLLLTKVSILLFYLRVFPSRGFRKAGYSMLAFVVLSGVIILFCQLFQCHPIRFNWDKSARDGKCLNVNALTYAHAGLNIAQDILILLLPIPWILRLKLQTHQKIGLVIMFQVGAFACVTAMVRLHFLAEFGGTNSLDPLWENSSATSWTAAEANSAVVCACLPAIRALYKKGKKMATEVSSKRRSQPVLSGKQDTSASRTNDTKQSDANTIEVHNLTLVESWYRDRDTSEQRPIWPTRPTAASSEEKLGSSVSTQEISPQPPSEAHTRGSRPHYANPRAKYIAIEAWAAEHRR